MELTPQSLHDVEFREARRGGYNTRDVDDFLERLAVGVSQQQDRLREAYHRAEAAEGRLAEMQRQLDEQQRRGPADTAGDADETLRRTLVLAQRTADATIKEAKDEANRLLGEARDEVAQARAAAESEAHRDARAELEELSASRDVLMADIETLEQHVDEQRERIRDGLDELQKVLDDPSSLRTEPAPKVSNVKPPPRPEPLPLSGNGSMAPPAPVGPAPAPAPASSSPNGGYGNSPFAGVDFKHLGNGAPVDEPAAAPSPSSVFDTPGFDTPGFVSVPPPPPPPSSPAPPNDGSMVGALQELHGTPPPPPPEPPLPGRDAIPGLDLPGREPLPSRGDGLSPRDPLPPRGEGLSPHDPLPARDIVPGRDPLPSRDIVPSRDPLPSRDIVPGRDPLPSRDIVPGRDPLPSRDIVPGRDPLPPRGDPLPPRGGEGLSPRDPLPARDSLPSRDREPLPTREAAREPLPMRDANREPLPTRNAIPPNDPIAVPGPGQPGSTGFLPDLNAVFNPPGPAPEPPPPVDDLPLPIDAPPPPPPPSGFDHLQDNGIPVEPGSRPSEWGRGVFDADDEFSSDDQHPRAPFGRRG